MLKCNVCEKAITSRNPGLECCKCGTLVHASQICAGVPAKQLAVLKNLDWICTECSRESPRLRSYMLSEDIEADTASCTSEIRETHKMLKDLATKLRNTLKTEVANLNGSINRFGSKLDEYGKMLETMNNKIRDLEKKNVYLTNRNNNLERRIGRLEEQIQIQEQNSLLNKVEIFGIPYKNDENIKEISTGLVKKLRVNKKHIKSVRRLPRYKDKQGPLLLELDDPQQAEDWIRASKQEPIFIHNVMPDQAPDAENGSARIIIRRATKHFKALLWTANQKLRPTYKHVWYQNGKVLARKEDADKPVVIQHEDDILKITQ